jgi:hypothetical protein
LDSAFGVQSKGYFIMKVSFVHAVCSNGEPPCWGQYCPDLDDYLYAHDLLSCNHALVSMMHVSLSISSIVHQRKVGREITCGLGWFKHRCTKTDPALSAIGGSSTSLNVLFMNCPRTLQVFLIQLDCFVNLDCGCMRVQMPLTCFREWNNCSL